MNSQHLDYIKRDTTHPYAITITQDHYKFGWPMSDRDFVFCSSVLYDKHKKRYIIARKTTRHPKAPPVKSVVRGVCLGGYLIEEISNMSSRLTQIAYCDMAGYIPIKLWNKLITFRGDEGHVALLKILSQQKKKQFPVPVDSQGFYETLVENDMPLQSQSFPSPHRGTTTVEISPSPRASPSLFVDHFQMFTEEK